MDIIERIKLVYRANRYKNRIDKTEIGYLMEVLMEGQTAIDIGAHKGGYLYNMLKRIGPRGQLYAFEPQKVLYKYLTQLKKIFKWDNVTVEPIALSNHKGQVSLFIPGNKGKSSSPGASITGNDNFDLYKIEKVEADTLDNYCNQHGIKPDFIKVDVEGNELEVFQGGIETLKKYRPKILFESEERHIGKEKVFETFRFLENIGYKGEFVKEDRIMSLKEFDFSKHQKKGKEPYCNNFIFE